MWIPVFGRVPRSVLGIRRTMRVIGRTSWVALAAIGFGGVALAEFPDAFNAPPAGWSGPVFRLSQSYPANLPRLEARSRRKWMDFDFRVPAEAPDYLRAVLNYCLEGNTTNGFADIGANSPRKWYHAPWLHTTAAGREFIRGLTRERPSRPGELGPLQVDQFENWAVGFYNARGGYTIGQVWKNETQPDPRKAKFPSHTVTCKLLFTMTSIAQAPFLEGTLEWQADVNRANGAGPRPTLRLLQIDVAVKEPRANPSIGWVFGTFQYEKSASTSPNWWEHMVPVGLMWGNDVDRVLANQPSREQWINTARGQALHLGFRGLLNGPVDNPRSSCVGCHGFAQIARVNSPSPSIPRPFATDNPSNSAIQNYFRRIKAASPLSPDYVSVDYSLQLQLGISRALTSNQVSLPANMNGSFFATGRPVATSIEGVTRGSESDSD